MIDDWDFRWSVDKRSKKALLINDEVLSEEIEEISILKQLPAFYTVYCHSTINISIVNINYLLWFELYGFKANHKGVE